MRAVLLVLPICLLSQPLRADDAGAPIYKRSGNAFACWMTKADYQISEAEKRDPCLRIGPLYVGMPRAKAEAVLGQAKTTGKQGEIEYFAYPLQDGDPAPTYAVMTYGKDGRVQSVQVTGLAWQGAWQFNGIALGDSEVDARSHLGEPRQLKVSNDPGSVEWGYDPWTFSLEIKGGVVSSIRVAQ